MINRRLLVAATALLAVAGSLVAGPGYALPRELPGGPLQGWTNRWGMSTNVLDRMVVGFGVPNFTTWEDHLVIDRVDLVNPGRVTLVDVRLALLVGGGMPRHPGYYAINTTFLTVCTGATYPPPGGQGPSWEAVGFDLLGSEYPALHIYLRADEPGWQGIDGLRVHYHDARGRHWVVDGYAHLRLNRVSTPGTGCDKRRGGIWTGDRDFLPYVVPLG
jgi:hypothetical protein